MSTSRIALVTGANKGIGYETVRLLAEQGMTVLLGARDAGRGEKAAATLREAGLEVRFVELDVTDDASVARAAAQVEQEMGRLDVLVNNAGTPSVEGRRSAPSTTSMSDMHAVYEVNVFGVVRVVNAFLPLLERSTSGRIVNVSSEVGSMTMKTSPDSPLSGFPPSVQYPSSKAAVNMITVQYAIELRDKGILVNAANPGWTRTDFGHGAGIRTPEQGAQPSVLLATLPDDGPTGILYGHLWTTTGDGDGGYGILPW